MPARTQRKKKAVKFLFRWRSEDDSRWEPTAWETNSKHKALAQAEKYRNREDAQVWDYVNKCAL